MFRKIDLKRATYRDIEMRVTPRSNCYCRLAITTPDFLQKHATVTDISADGLQFSCEYSFDTGDSILIKLPLLGAIRARVIWCKGHRTGVEFDVPIVQSDYLPLMKALGGRPVDQ